jgi:hypothetical protein
VSGFAAGEAASAPAISLLDEAGDTLHRALVNEDGSCELSEEALASAHDVLVGPVTVTLRAHEFRGLVAAEGIIDVTARRAKPAHETLAPAALAGARMAIGGEYGDGGERGDQSDCHHPIHGQDK